MLTKQEIFNKAWLGLKAQGFRRAWSKRRQSCQYRAPDGTKCAVGHVLPDGFYDPSFDSRGLGVYELPSSVLNFFGVPTAFLSALQKCHDDSLSPDHMEKNLRHFAKVRELTIPESSDA